MRNIFHYDILTEFNKEYYKNILRSNNICGDEIAISETVAIEKTTDGKKKEIKESVFYYPCKLGRKKYLLPSEALDKFPLRVVDVKRKAHSGAGYWKITSSRSVKIKEEQTKGFREFIDSWLDYEHERADLFTLYKIIVHTAYTRRINVRVMTYPGWLKDSPVLTLGMLRGDTVSINKPSYARLKREIAAGNKILVLNEMQKFKEEEKELYNKFYEDVGDFKPEFRNPSCSVKGSEDVTDIRSMSTLTFYNVPKKPEDHLFDDDLDPKNCGRIFPLFFEGGSQKRTANRQKHGDINGKITEEEKEAIIDMLRVQKYYSNPDNFIKIQKNYTRKYEYPSDRWQRNYEVICSGLSAYAKDQEEFTMFEDLLYDAHKKYHDVLANREHYCNDNSIEEGEYGSENDTTLIDLSIKEGKLCH